MGENEYVDPEIKERTDRAELYATVLGTPQWEIFREEILRRKEFALQRLTTYQFDDPQKALAFLSRQQGQVSVLDQLLREFEEAPARAGNG